jgi:hypothetical protein
MNKRLVLVHLRGILCACRFGKMKQFQLMIEKHCAFLTYTDWKQVRGLAFKLGYFVSGRVLCMILKMIVDN